MLFASLALSLAPLAQTGPTPAPRQALTPKQSEDKRQTDAFFAERTRLTAAAKQAFDAELAREKAGACKAAYSTYEAVTCLSTQQKITSANYAAMVANLRALLALKSPYSDDQPMLGPSGYSLTSAEQTAEFDQMQQAWESYRKIAASVAFDQFKGGTEAPVSGALSALMLVRSHMRELASLYDFALGNH